MFFSAPGQEGSEGSLREQFRRLAQSAAEQGVEAAARFFRMTPREIHLTLLTHRARMDRQWEKALLHARLTALAVHDPARLPSLPPPRLPDMTADEMKQRLLAGRRKDEQNDP